MPIYPIFRPSSYPVAGAVLSGLRRPGGASVPPQRTALDVLAESVAWWEADDAGNIVVSDAFSQLTDLCGNGNHLVQSTPANRPAVATGGGLTWAEFNGTSSMMHCGCPTAALMNNFDTGGTAIFILRPDTDGESGLGRVFDKGGGDLMYFGNETGSAVRMFTQFDHAAQEGQVNHADLSTKAVVRLDAWRYNKAVGSSSGRANYNGTDMTIGDGLSVGNASSGAASDASGFKFFLGNREDLARTFDGGIYAAAFWDTELSDADLLLVIQSLADKYGLTLP